MEEVWLGVDDLHELLHDGQVEANDNVGKKRRVKLMAEAKEGAFGLVEKRRMTFGDEPKDVKTYVLSFGDLEPLATGGFVNLNEGVRLRWTSEYTGVLKNILRSADIKWGDRHPEGGSIEGTDPDGSVNIMLSEHQLLVLLREKELKYGKKGKVYFNGGGYDLADRVWSAWSAKVAEPVPQTKIDHPRRSVYGKAVDDCDDAVESQMDCVVTGVEYFNGIDDVPDEQDYKVTLHRVDDGDGASAEMTIVVRKNELPRYKVGFPVTVGIVKKSVDKLAQCLEDYREKDRAYSDLAERKKQEKLQILLEAIDASCPEFAARMKAAFQVLTLIDAAVGT